MKIIKIILSLIVISCQGQKKNETYYTPIKLAYTYSSPFYILNEKTIMNYVTTNPLVARQVYDYNLKVFQETNSKVKFTKKECSDLILNYVKIKTDSTYFGIFYNPNSNQKLESKKFQGNNSFMEIFDDTIYYKCICLNNNLLVLPDDYKEIQSEYNLPGGYVLENKEFKSKFFIKMIDSLKNDVFVKINIFNFSERMKTIKNTKVNIFSNISSPTKMYLLKGDEVEIIEEENDWLKIRYYGKKTIEGWIKKNDVE